LNSRLGHNCLDKFLDETRDQDTKFETKTKTVKILSRDETVSRDFPSLDIASLKLEIETVSTVCIIILSNVDNSSKCEHKIDPLV